MLHDLRKAAADVNQRLLAFLGGIREKYLSLRFGIIVFCYPVIYWNKKRIPLTIPLGL